MAKRPSLTPAQVRLGVLCSMNVLPSGGTNFTALRYGVERFHKHQAACGTRVLEGVLDALDAEGLLRTGWQWELNYEGRLAADQALREHQGTGALRSMLSQALRLR